MKKILLFITLISFAIAQSQIVNIPDTNFKNALLNHTPTIDTNGDNEIQVSEAENFTSGLNLEYKNISNLTGISSFINITGLNLFQNNLNNLDLASNTNLETLTCAYNNLTILDVSNQTSLTTLICYNNNLNSISLNNPNLTTLYCEKNELLSINLNSCVSLEDLTIFNNPLTDIDFINNTNIIELEIGNNQIVNLDLSPLSQLEHAFIGGDVGEDDIYIETINLKNGNNNDLDITEEGIMGMPNLTDVCVDDINNTAFSNYIINGVGHSVNFTENCSTLSVLQKHLLAFSIFPIPTENILNIKSKTEIVKTEIYSKLGQKIKETTESKIDISNLTQNLYFVKVKDVNGNFGVKKIVKK